MSAVRETHVREACVQSQHHPYAAQETHIHVHHVALETPIHVHQLQLLHPYVAREIRIHVHHVAQETPIHVHQLQVLHPHVLNLYHAPNLHKILTGVLLLRGLLPLVQSPL